MNRIRNKGADKGNSSLAAGTSLHALPASPDAPGSQCKNHKQGARIVDDKRHHQAPDEDPISRQTPKWLPRGPPSVKSHHPLYVRSTDWFAAAKTSGAVPDPPQFERGVAIDRKKFEQFLFKLRAYKHLARAASMSEDEAVLLVIQELKSDAPLLLGHISEDFFREDGFRKLEHVLEDGFKKLEEAFTIGSQGDSMVARQDLLAKFATLKREYGESFSSYARRYSDAEQMLRLSDIPLGSPRQRATKFYRGARMDEPCVWAVNDFETLMNATRQHLKSARRQKRHRLYSEGLDMATQFQ